VKRPVSLKKFGFFSSWCLAMQSFPAKSWESAARWGQRALAAAAAAVLFAVLATSASASCGDWLADPSHKLADQAGTAANSADTGTLESGLPKGPCSGPGCRKAPERSAPPVPTTITLRVDKLVIREFASLVSQAGLPFGPAAESDDQPARGFFPRIEHPPRV
jgi:hypothetical protein